VYLLTVTGLTACKDARLFDASSCPSIPPLTFYKLLEIERYRPIANTARARGRYLSSPASGGSEAVNIWPHAEQRSFCNA